MTHFRKAFRSRTLTPFKLRVLRQMKGFIKHNTGKFLEDIRFGYYLRDLQKLA